TATSGRSPSPSRPPGSWPSCPTPSGRWRSGSAGGAAAGAGAGPVAPAAPARSRSRPPPPKKRRSSPSTPRPKASTRSRSATPPHFPMAPPTKTRADPAKVPDQVTVKLPDGSTRQYAAGVTPAEIAASIGRRLADAAVAASVDGATVDLDRPIAADAEVAIPTADGFYSDFELPAHPDGTPAHFTEADLERIDARMREIIGEAQPFVREEMDKAAGLELFADQPFKREIIEGAESTEGAEAGVVSVYRNPHPSDGDGFVDLCRGPHVPHTKRLGAFKLMKVAGA